MKEQIRILKALFTFPILILTFTSFGNAQFLEDALRLEYGGFGIGARALGMGTAFLPVANDFGATYWNPAGLSQIRNFEFTGGLSHHSLNNDARYLGTTTGKTGSATDLNNLGLVIPVPTIQGSLTFALGFNRVNNFSSALGFDSYNSISSIIPTLFHSDPDFDMAYNLYLNDDDGDTPLVNNMQQSGRVTEGGGINNWNFSGAIEAVKDLHFGLTLNFISGSYRFDRMFIEEDIRDAHINFPYDFDRLELDNRITADISGFNARFGMLYQPVPAVTIGATIKPPSTYSVDERFSSYGQSWFDDGDTFNYEIRGTTDYKISTPWMLAAGTSFSLRGITLAGSLEYTDWTQLEFRDADPEVMRENQIIKDFLEPTTTLRGGVEYIIPEIDLALRAGYFVQPSAYRDDPSSYDRKYVTLGAGFRIQDMVTLDAAYARGTWDTHRIHYAGGPRIEESITQSSLIFTLGYRF
jgi:long-subunit fatty acid transport protein